MIDTIKGRLKSILKGPINYLPQHKVKFSIWIFIMIACLTDLETIATVPVIWLFVGWLSSRKLKPGAAVSLSVSPVTLITSKKGSKMNMTTFRVAGISDERVQQAIRHEIVEVYLEYNEPYEGMTNKEILEEYEDVYEVDIEGTDEITLAPDPDNPYNERAIRVEHGMIGKIGYVPDSMIDKVYGILLRNNYSLEWRLLGGKVKSIAFDDEKGRDVVVVRNLTYGIEITLTEQK